MHYEAVILDLDGVVYIGPDAVPHAIDSLNRLAVAGTTLSAATNNANRPAALVADHLCDLGLHIEAENVMTSAQAAAVHLASLLSAGSEVLAVGGDGVADSLVAVGLVPLRASQDLAECNEVADRAAAVVMGYGPTVAWFDLATAHWAIERGKPWFATNTDPTVPLPFGRAPGNGAMVGLLRTSTGINPTVIGKPQPALFEALASKLATREVLVIGDRLDTDIDGALAAAMDSLLVLTGVHEPRDLALRPTSQWPTFVAQDLRSFTQPVVKLRFEQGQVVADALSDDPLVRAVVDAAEGRESASGWKSDGPSPLIDVRALAS